MSAAIYPERIQAILDTLNNGEDWSDWYDLCQFTTKRDRYLTEVFCSSNDVDFITMDGDDAFLFTCDEKTSSWEVKHVGCPVYEIEPEMLNESVDLNQFLNELKYELPGVEVKCRPGAALSNMKSEFVQQFKTELNRAFQNAIDNCF